VNWHSLDPFYSRPISINSLSLTCECHNFHFIIENSFWEHTWNCTIETSLAFSAAFFLSHKKKLLFSSILFWFLQTHCVTQWVRWDDAVWVIMMMMHSCLPIIIHTLYCSQQWFVLLSTQVVVDATITRLESEKCKREKYHHERVK